MPSKRRIATLVAFVHIFETAALDDAMDVFDMLISEISAQAKKIGKKHRLRTLKDLDQAALDLSKVCSILLDQTVKNEQLRDKIFTQLSEDRLREAITTVINLARPKDDDYHKELTDRYRRVRLFLPTLLKTIKFKATPSGTKVLKAVKYLRAIEGKHKPDMKNAPQEILTQAWKRLAVNQDGTIDRPAYTLCVIKKLRDSLRRRDIFVLNSARWSDTRKKLLHGEQWKSQRTPICRMLSLPVCADTAIKNFEKYLKAAYQKTIKNFASNEFVRIENIKGNPELIISNLEKIDESPSLIYLREQVSALMPHVDLPELLLEIQAQTGFADEFTHISEGKARTKNFEASVCGVLIAEACNIGFAPVTQPDQPALTSNRLSWVMQNFIRSDTLIRANARLVDYQNNIPLVKCWGSGDVASADGLRFVTPLRTINSGPNLKYFGFRRGITYYNFTSDQYTGFHGIVIPGTIRDSLFILEGLLEQQTSLNPTEIMADTSGVSDIIFGLFWLLGYQFSPRLADAGGTRLWRIDSRADYGVLNEFSRNIINPKRIKHHWDDALRVAGSLKIGSVSASELIRSLLKSDRPSGLAMAIADLGRISKTIYLLNFIDDETYRRRILVQLNRGEARHVVARAICYGKRGEIRKRYREGQEDQLGALGLVTNAVVLWNTIYMESALNHLKRSGLKIDEDDIKHLSPLSCKHINVLGHYSFSLPETVANGNLRPLNIPLNTNEIP